jgi:hypothetical protein
MSGEMDGMVNASLHGELPFDAWITGNNAQDIEPAAASDNILASVADEALTACY